MKIIDGSLVLEEHDYADMDVILSDIIHNALLVYKRRKRYCIPSIIVNNNPDVSETALSFHWDMILDEMIYAFSELDDINNADERRSIGRKMFANYFCHLWE